MYVLLGKRAACVKNTACGFPLQLMLQVFWHSIFLATFLDNFTANPALLSGESDLFSTASARSGRYLRSCTEVIEFPSLEGMEMNNHRICPFCDFSQIKYIQCGCPSCPGLQKTVRQCGCSLYQKQPWRQQACWMLSQLEWCRLILTNSPRQELSPFCSMRKTDLSLHFCMQERWWHFSSLRYGRPIFFSVWLFSDLKLKEMLDKQVPCCSGWWCCPFFTMRNNDLLWFDFPSWSQIKGILKSLLRGVWLVRNQEVMWLSPLSRTQDACQLVHSGWCMAHFAQANLWPVVSTLFTRCTVLLVAFFLVQVVCFWWSTVRYFCRLSITQSRSCLSKTCGSILNVSNTMTEKSLLRIWVVLDPFWPIYSPMSEDFQEYWSDQIDKSPDLRDSSKQSGIHSWTVIVLWCNSNLNPTLTLP